MTQKNGQLIILWQYTYCTWQTSSITSHNLHFLDRYCFIEILEFNLIQHKGPDIVTESVCV